jgi:glycine cleavage system H protein
MDGFTYHNIFETKGIEYIAIICFFLVLIPFWLLLNRPLAAKAVKKSIGILTAGILRIPEGLFFSRNHTWAHLERSGLAKIGLDDFILHVTGAVKFNVLRLAGEKVSKGDVIAEIDHNGKKLKVYSPVSGDIIKLNPELTASPSKVNDDPYTEGWMYEIKPSQWKAEISSFYLADEAAQWISNELARFKDFLAGSVMKLTPGAQVAYQDGGDLLDNTLSNLPMEVWDDFQKHFLDPSR